MWPTHLLLLLLRRLFFRALGLLWVFWFCLLGLGGGVQLLRGLNRRLLQLKDLLQDPGFLALFPLPELPAKCSPRALGKAP